ncbi:SDR family NAD(P)-dependent oxidoreductase [Achromobacter dolens]|uniref:SDR family NAD(P)-dependent oxidoreductase n=1 Tax=Achromobacter dolens TaxID=1287738 RepID=UPI001468FF80|nr:SDR family oxidoreductase [Achromobacter dolens]CAB3634923.1 3-oxoacyl-[acyl-carrier-protein] reductase FabG [Achromobacter dolens]
MTTPIALVTGGSRGIGRAIVARLLQDGFEVVNFSRRPPESALPGERFQSVDLGDAAATAAAASALAAARPVLHLVNNAGMIQVADIEAVTQNELARMVAVNLTAPLLLMQALLPGMRQAGYGRVVNIGSRAGLGKPGRTVYGATKSGLVGMTRTWALELGKAGITVNTVAPGPIATELFDQSNPPGDPRTVALEAAIPVGRIGRPEDVAHAVSSFLDRRAGFMTGQVLYVCGGMSVGLAG